MSWIYFIIPIIAIAIPIIILSFEDEQKLTLKETLEIYYEGVDVSLANKTDNICKNVELLEEEYILNAINAINEQVAYWHEVKDYYPNMTLDNSVSLTITSSDAYKLLRNIGIENVKLGDNFRCSIPYKGNYYTITLYIYDYPIFEDESYGIIRITNAQYNNINILSLDPKSLELWKPFNNNVMFVNELGNKVRVTILNNDQIYESFSILPYSNVTKRIRAPDVPIHSTNETIKYYVLPYNLEGKITVNSYPPCMDKEQATMLFGLVGVKMRFPKYLPEGYEYECTVHVLNNIAKSYYSDELGRSLYGKGRQYVNNIYKEHALIISTSKRLSYEEFDIRSLYEEIKRYYDPNALTINNREAIAYHYSIGFDSNVILISYDDHTYRIEGKLSMDELIKIAQSLDG